MMNANFIKVLLVSASVLFLLNNPAWAPPKMESEDPGRNTTGSRYIVAPVTELAERFTLIMGQRNEQLVSRGLPPTELTEEQQRIMRTAIENRQELRMRENLAAAQQAVRLVSANYPEAARIVNRRPDETLERRYARVMEAINIGDGSNIRSETNEFQQAFLTALDERRSGDRQASEVEESELEILRLLVEVGNERERDIWRDMTRRADEQLEQTRSFDNI